MGQDRDEDFGLPVKQAPAIGYSIITNLGGDRQMTVQCFVGEDEGTDEINTKIDRILSIVDRQKARYDLERLENQFEETGRHLRNFLNAIPVAEKSAEHQVAALKARLAEQQAVRKDVFEEGYSAHVRAGRQGAFVPTGALKGRLGGIDAEIRKTEEAIAAVPNDTAQHKAQAVVNIQKYQDDLRKQRRAINDMRKLAGLPDNDLFMVEQEAKVEG